MGRRPKNVHSRRLKDGTTVYDAAPRIGGRVVWKRGFKTTAEATAWIAQARLDYEEGRLITPSRQTVEQWFTDYMGRMVWRENVRLTYTAYCRNHIYPALGTVKLQHLDWKRLTDFYARLSAKGLADHTVRNIHGFISGALKDAVRKGVLKANAAALADLPKRGAPPEGDEPRPWTKGAWSWTAEQLSHFFATNKGSRWYAGFRLLAFPGLRRGELAGLRWENLDFEKKQASIKQAVGRGRIIGEPKTKNARRAVPLDDETLTALRELRKQQMSEGRQSEWVYPGKDGGPITPGRINQALEKACERAGLPLISPHGLRRTWSTVALDAGVPEKLIQSIMGHSRPATTWGYMDPTDAMKQKAAETAANAVAIYGAEEKGLHAARTGVDSGSGQDVGLDLCHLTSLCRTVSRAPLQAAAV